MRISTIGKSSLIVSYVIFVAVCVALFALMAEFKPNPAPFGFLLALALGWQVFTLYFHRHHLLTWILAVFYAMFLIYFLRPVA
jgi:hypothetical protein